MKAFILAAGLGTRLGSLTNDKPKALVKVQGQEMLALAILHLKKQGFNEFIVNVHHHAEMVISYLKANQNFGVQIHISEERKQLMDTGGALLHARTYLTGDEPILIHNVDIISELNYADLLSYHKAHHAMATLCVRTRKSGRSLLFDDKMHLKGWQNNLTGEQKWSSSPFPRTHPYAFSGIYLVSPEFIKTLKMQGKFSIIDAWLSSAKAYKIIGYPDKSPFWFDLGTNEKIRQAELYLKNQVL